MDTDWLFTLPFLCGLLWCIGGREGGRYYRRIGVGLAVGCFTYAFTHNLVSFLSIFTYWIVTSLGYGKLIEKRQWFTLFFVGCSFGVACFPVQAITGSSIFFYQGPIAGVIFTGLTYWSNTGKHALHWALAEGFTGIGATILIPWMILGAR